MRRRKDSRKDDSAPRRLSTTIFLFLLPGIALVGCREYPVSMLDPKGPGASQINVLWWIMFWVGLAVYVAVMGYLLVALFRRRRDPEPDEPLPPEGTQIVVWAGGVVPAVIIVGIFGATLFTMNAVRDPEIPEELTIEVIGRQWWWEIGYPEFDFRTANEIHIPVGQAVRIEMTSEDVIHSFWVPELHGKLDLVPGHPTSFWLEADVPGVYLGECAEFCGVQHAKMQFLVIALPPEEFLEWVTQQQVPAAVPEDERAQRGMEIFLSSDCVMCHAIEGTGATGALGPDLTHIASRRTLGAGTVPNTRGHLGGWIANPHGIKPGVLMPPADLTGAELQALLDYLETLE